MLATSLYAAKPAFRRRLDPIADGLAARAVHPDTLTYAAVGCGVLSGAALALGALPLVAPLAFARITLNALDGMVAERAGLARPWGKVLNELCDRLADLAFLGGLFFVPGVPPYLAAAAIVMVLLASHVGVLAEAAGAQRQYSGPMGKADRMLWLSLAATAAWLLGAPELLAALPALLLVGGAATLVARLAAIHTLLGSARRE